MSGPFVSACRLPQVRNMCGMRNLAMLLISSTLLFAAEVAPSAPAKAAPKYQDGSCCDKAAKKGEKCVHPCCVKATKAGKVCDHCNEPAKK